MLEGIRRKQCIVGKKEGKKERKRERERERILFFLCKAHLIDATVKIILH
jgi:hypothetical protein